MRAFLRELWQDESGQSMAEYGLLTALIAVVGLGAVRVLGSSISGKFLQLAETIGG
ncbi:MAG: Flp family type IVb pilin [Firmicutes bacterium]|nr:Flp family type IVb pilin [Bacillota bacterium]